MELVKLLLEANNAAAATAHQVCHSAYSLHHWRSRSSAHCICAPPLYLAVTRDLDAHRAAQDGMLPLQLAIVKGMPISVVVLLLEANREATAAADKARLPTIPVPCRIACGRRADQFRIASCHAEWTAAAAPRHYAGRFRGGGDSAAQRG